MLPFLLAFSFVTIQKWVTERGFTGGVIVIVLLLFACGLGLPLPEDIPLIVSGAFLCTDTKSWIIVGTAAWVGIIGGDCIIYFMGRRYGMEISRVPLIGKHLTRERVERVERLFEDYGVGVVGVGRLFAGIRGAVVFVAGAIRFNFLKFIIVDGLAAIISGGLFMLLGHWIGEKLIDPAAQKKIHEFKEIVFFTAGFLACGVIVFYVWRRRNRERLHDVEEKVATKVIAAEKAVTDKIVQVVKKPPPEPPPADPALTGTPDGPTVQDQSQTQEGRLTMPLQVKPLGFDFAALEPHIDAKTMEIHHGKHYATYVNNYNDAIKKQPELDGKPLHEVLANNCAMVKDEIRTTIRNNGGGAHNHALFWEILNPAGKSGAEPSGKLADAIKSTFGGFAQLKEKFEAAGKTRFGSGWAWLVKKGDKLEVISTANQDSPIMEGAFPVIGLDVWEHAYYLKYQNRRPDYIAAWWNVVNWKVADERFGRAK